MEWSGFKPRLIEIEVSPILRSLAFVENIRPGTQKLQTIVKFYGETKDWWNLESVDMEFWARRLDRNVIHPYKPYSSDIFAEFQVHTPFPIFHSRLFFAEERWCQNCSPNKGRKVFAFPLKWRKIKLVICASPILICASKTSRLPAIIRVACTHLLKLYHSGYSKDFLLLTCDRKWAIRETSFRIYNPTNHPPCERTFFACLLQKDKIADTFSSFCPF